MMQGTTTYTNYPRSIDATDSAPGDEWGYVERTATDEPWHPPEAEKIDANDLVV